LKFFFYLLRLRRYKGKRVKTRCYQEGVGHLEPRFQGKGSSLGNIFGLCKTGHILLSDSANCTAVVLTQYRRVADGRTDGQTDGQTDGIAIASTALAMRALRGAVKNLKEIECGPMPNVMAAMPNDALCKTSVIPFLVPCRKVWLTPAAGVP